MKLSAGLLLYRGNHEELDVLLAHIGGPLWEHRELGAWTIPKGEVDAGEAPYTAALREFTEEMGSPPPPSDQPDIPLGTFRQNTRKDIIAWARHADFDAASIRSNMFEMEWPPRSGRMVQFPEVDRAQWFVFDDALRHIVSGQQQVLHALQSTLADAART